MVGALDGVPGIRNRIAVIPPPVMDAQYTEKVSFVVLIPVSRVEEIKKAVTEAVSGRAGMEEVEQLFYALIDGEYICF